MPDHVQSPDSTLPLHRHHLNYIANLRLGEEVLAPRFARGCDPNNCSGACCGGGVLVDIAHRDRVLAEAQLVVRYMEPSQEHDPGCWFEDEVVEDPDYPSGRAVCTTVVNDTCVFLDSNRRCVLHMAEAESPALKPFYCRAYPVAIVRGRITLDTEWCPEETQCCATVAEGELSGVDVYAGELLHLLGADGERELRDLVAQRQAPR
jgi:Fe-S-cluster containining protein